jgi:dethiobiotin synthetase
MPTWFVTGTGTAVGKTLVTAALCHQLQVKGRRVRALKPVMSGYRSEEAQTSDAGVLLRSLSFPVNEDAIRSVCPWRFEAPLSPDMAAAREDRALDFEAIVEFCRRAGPSDAEEIVLIEGVGGVMVPLDAGHTVLDWIAALEAPTLLVAGSYLGTISHTLTAIAALRARGVTLRKLVISESIESPVPLVETAETIERYAPGLDVALIPRLLASDEPWRSAPDLTSLVD